MFATLRPYQQRAVDDVLASLPRNPVMVIPTGGGKTVAAARIVRAVADDASRDVLWCVHRRELVAQAAAHLRAVGLRTRIILAGEDDTPDDGDGPLCHVASVQTIARREMPENLALVVIDEAHHAVAASYAPITRLAVPIVGLTATPFRLDGRGLGDVFGALVVAATPAELVRNGYLVEPTVFAPPGPDMRGAKIVGGDFSASAISDAMDEPHLVADVVATWLKHAAKFPPPWRTVVYAAGVEHSQHLVAEFSRHGIAAEHLDGTTPREERDAILARLRDGTTRVVSNFGVLTEGWDLPALECCVVARPTASRCLHLQMIGRIMRPADDKLAAVVLDHAGNHLRHGRVTDEIQYTLDDRDVVARDEAVSPVRTCHACFAVVPDNAMVCPNCGAELAREEKQIAVIDGELVELKSSQELAQEFSARRETWKNLEIQRKLRNYQPGWSAHKFREKFGEWPVIGDGELVDPHSATFAQKRAVYKNFLRIATERGFAPGWASYRYREVFGRWPSGFVNEVKLAMGVGVSTWGGR